MRPCNLLAFRSSAVRLSFVVAALLVSVGIGQLSACDLCAIYRATNARGESSAGFIMTLSQQYVEYGTLQDNGKEFHQPPTRPGVPRYEEAYLDTSITHVVPGYNFSDQFGVSLNIPLIYRQFRRVQLNQFFTDFSKRFDTQTGSVFGPGDMSLVGRWTPLRISQMKYSIVGSLFAGVKFPTGDTDFLDREVARERADYAILGTTTGHPHAIGGIHQHDLTLGSGSYDGVFGSAVTLRWDRFFFAMQGQYYLRTRAHDYEFGDEIIVSGGPGGYILLNKSFTLTLQANAIYDTMAMDRSLYEKNIETGWTGWFVGPQLNFTWGDHFSVNGGVDIPIHIGNNGRQTVPDYRFHGGLSWKF